MTDTTELLKKEIQTGMDQMRALRDEVRLKLHLASMDAKDEWNKLEPHLLDVERAAEELTDTARTKITDAVTRLSKLKSSLM